MTTMTASSSNTLLMLLLAAAAVPGLHAVVPMRDAVAASRDGGVRIIDGNLASPGQFPYQAAVYINNRAFCGGSVISDHWVLTAAHCVDGGEFWTLYLGAHNMMAPAESPARQVLTTRLGHHHENYNRETLENDVAVIKTYSAIEFNARVQPVRLPTKQQMDQTFANTNAVVSGWGKPTNTAGGISPVLKYADVTIISEAECVKRYDSEPIFHSTLCAQGRGIDSTCNGDSGGPLVVKGADGKPTQVGVVSFVSDSGCDKGMPHGYARLTSFMTWVSSQTGVPLQ